MATIELDELLVEQIKRRTVREQRVRLADLLYPLIESSDIGLSDTAFIASLVERYCASLREKELVEARALADAQADSY